MAANPTAAQKDALGRPVPLAGPAGRIVSLVPSLTELVFALGCGGKVVGVSDYCVHPEEGLAGLPRVGGQKDPDLSRLLGLRPDLVLANKEENLRRDVLALEAAGVAVYVTDVRTVAAALDLPGALGLPCGADPGLVAEVAGAMAAGVGRGREAAARRGRPVRVAVPIWRDPFILAGTDTYIDDVLSALGGWNVARDLAGRPGNQRYPKAGLEEVRRLGPDLVLLPSEPYPFGPADEAEVAAAVGVPARRCDGTVLCWYGPRTGRIHELSPLLG